MTLRLLHGKTIREKIRKGGMIYIRKTRGSGCMCDNKNIKGSGLAGDLANEIVNKTMKKRSKNQSINFLKQFAKY